MTANEREAWDRRYREGTYRPRAAHSPFLEHWLAHAPPGRALDVACGTGRNARLLARAGFEVTAVDISSTAVDRGRREAEAEGLTIDWRVADLDDFPVQEAAFTLVSVVRYRNRDLWPRLRQGLATNGWLVVEHHLATHLDAGGPQDPAFRLQPGELLQDFGDLRIVHYTESVDDPDHPDHGGGPFVTARFAACDGDPGW